MQARLAIQCVDSTGKRGSFLFTGDFLAISPVYDSCMYVFDWCKANGWSRIENDPDPVGTYQKGI